MTGTIGNLEKRLLSLYRFRENEQELLPAETRLNGKTYWDYVLPALARHRCMDELFEEFGLLPSHDNLLYDDPAEFQVKRITARTLTEAEVVEQAVGQMEDDILDNWDCEKIVDPEIRAELEKRFGFVYPYEYRKDIPVKVSVSDLKRRVTMKIRILKKLYISNRTLFRWFQDLLRKRRKRKRRSQVRQEVLLTIV